MPVLQKLPFHDAVSEMHDEIMIWRHFLHQNPELQYDVFKTSEFVAKQLADFGVDEVVTGIGKTGVVGIIYGQQKGPLTIGFRADMDALPIHEISGVDWASQTPGKMHACGHDGHTSMLLGAAKYLSQTRNFSGKIVVIFQPAEEGGAGALAMINDGLMERFGIDQVYGMHNMPGIPAGEFAVAKGPFMASTDTFVITLNGRGGHAAYPHSGTDTILAGSQLVSSLQMIASRNIDPLKSVVVSVTKFHAGMAMNVLPEEAVLSGTVRTLDNLVRDDAEARLKDIAAGIAKTHNMDVDVQYRRSYPVTVNHGVQTDFAVQIASDVVGEKFVNPRQNPSMGAEDFSYMLEARPGCFMFLGNGDTPALHNAAYDFNDTIIPYGVSYWIQLAERSLPLHSNS